MRFQKSLVMVCLVSGLLMPGYSQTNAKSKKSHSPAVNPVPPVCPEATQIVEVNLCELAIQMRPSGRPRGMSILSKDHKKQFGMPEHHDVTLRVSENDEIVWKCMFNSEPGQTNPAQFAFRKKIAQLCHRWFYGCAITGL